MYISSGKKVFWVLTFWFNTLNYFVSYMCPSQQTHQPRATFRFKLVSNLLSVHLLSVHMFVKSNQISLSPQATPSPSCQPIL